MHQGQESTEKYRIVVESIGHASPASAAAVAKGLGISAADVIRCLYRAPAVLVDAIEHHIALQLVNLLSSIGYQVKMEQQSSPLPACTKLFEMAVYLTDANQFVSASQKLAEFIGTSEQEAGKLLLTPPGTVLGSVSQATVSAFKTHMAGTVDVIDQPQQQGLFSLFLGDCPAVVRQRLHHDLQTQGVQTINQHGLIATDIPHDQLLEIWQRHRANAQLRIVNQAFLRYDLTLTDPRDQRSGLALNQTQKQLITRLTDIPDDFLDTVLSATPVALLESIPHADMIDCLQQFNQADIAIQADLITFQMLQLNIIKAPMLKKANELLTSFDIPPVSAPLPQRIATPLPEIQARVIQNAMDQLGIVSELIR
ncbi:hypothetical protein [Gynuella sp.]|uniref:hypothetical protein n=1 Tax=Gynuella sp. TaxID=2969146 RepID=UPI003D0FF1C9